MSAVALDLVDATPTAMLSSRLGVAAFPGGAAPPKSCCFKPTSMPSDLPKPSLAAFAYPHAVLNLSWATRKS
jgi:hypothetical protein